MINEKWNKKWEEERRIRPRQGKVNEDDKDRKSIQNAGVENKKKIINKK